MGRYSNEGRARGRMLRGRSGGRDVSPRLLSAAVPQPIPGSRGYFFRRASGAFDGLSRPVLVGNGSGKGLKPFTFLALEVPLRHRPARLRPHRQPPLPGQPHAARESRALRLHHPSWEFRPPLRHPPVRRPRPSPLPPAPGNAASREAAPPPSHPQVRRQRHPHQRRADRRLPGRPDLGRRLDRRRLPRRPHVLSLPRSRQRRPRPYLPRPRLLNRDRPLPRRLRPGPTVGRPRKIARAAVLGSIVSGSVPSSPSPPDPPACRNLQVLIWFADNPAYAPFQ